MDINLTPPTNDPSLPCFELDEFREARPDLVFMQDMWDGLRRWCHPLKGIVDSEKANAYLPKNPAESMAEYARRVATVFSPRFEMVVDGFAGLLSEFTYDGPDQLAQYFENVDLMGNSLPVFLKDCDKDALRDGGVFIGAEYPPQSREDIKSKSLYDDQYSSNRPYLIRINMMDVPNHSHSFIDGGLVITHMSIREEHDVPFGLYGTRKEVYWRVLTPGAWVLYDVVTDNNGDWVAVEIESGTTSLDRVPVVFYSITNTVPFSSSPPMFKLGEIIKHQYQQASDYYTSLHKTNLPVALLTGNVDLSGSGGSLVIGPNSFLSLPEGSSFQFVEPSGSALTVTKTALDDLDIKIDLFNLDFMHGSDSNKTATEVTLQSKQTESMLKIMATQKESVVATLFSFFGQYTNLENTGTITINKDLLVPPNTPEQVVAVFNAGIISQITAIRKLGKLGMISDPEAELALIDQEKIKAIAEGAVFGQQQEEEKPLNSEAPPAGEEDQPATTN